MPRFNAPSIHRQGWLAIACLVSGCIADPANDAAHVQQRTSMRSEGIALVSDACIYRQTPPLQHNYYPIADSVRAATAIQSSLNKRLSAFGYRIASTSTPFVCGGLFLDPPRSAWIADAIDKPPTKTQTFPAVAQPALQKDPALQKAYQQLMRVAAETITADSLNIHRHEHLTPDQISLLRKSLHASNLLVTLGRGASVSVGMKAADTVAGFLLVGQIGSGGCSLSDKDCGLSDTGHDGFRIGAVLIDLDQPDLLWLGSATDITGHQGTFDNNDPLDPLIYADPTWAAKLLKTFPGHPSPQ